MAMKYSEVDDVMEFWIDPSNQQAIFDTIPLDCLTEDKPEMRSVQPTGNPSRSEDERGMRSVQPNGDPPFPEPQCRSGSLPYRFSGSLPYRFISDDEYKLPPYNSVGKLFWIRSNTKEVMFSTTAFYIGDGKIMTVAHAFDSKIIKHDGQFFTKKITEGIFVPAMTDNKDIYGKHYGCFRASDYRQHSDYTKKNLSKNIHPHYDICTVKIGYGKKKEINGAEVAFTEVDVSTIPIITPCPLALDQPNMRYYTWIWPNTIWYRRKSKSRWEDDGI